MPLAPIPLRTVIVDKDGAITEFYRLRWEELRTASGMVAAKGIYQNADSNAAIVSQPILTALTGGIYRVTFTARRIVADGAGSSLTFTFHGTDGALPLSLALAANTTDTTAAIYTGTAELLIDANSDITFDMGYTSTTPGAMHFKVTATAELIAQG